MSLIWTGGEAERCGWAGCERAASVVYLVTLKSGPRAGEVATRLPECSECYAASRQRAPHGRRSLGVVTAGVVAGVQFETVTAVLGVA